MYLRRLALKGFKSFADPISIGLEPGVTVVVGPNGSGKSNFVDGVAWVLGAQAPSAVRSGRMDDVIFAGTTSKPPLGRAEVSLTIDNTDQELPLAFSEVSITRTLFRSGESTYALNGTPCRLLDITEMLADHGVGRQQHVIVSQNQIDAILNARPSDRRSVVEDAAGVLKFRQRRERAERRLANTDADLVRVKDLRREVQRQLRPLKKQAEAAKQHAELVSELETLRVYLAGREIAELRKRLREQTDDAAAKASAAGVLRDELDELNKSAADCENQLLQHRGHESAELLVRWEGLRQRGRGLALMVDERLKASEEQRAVLGDSALVEALVAEATNSRRELAAISTEAAAAAQVREMLDTEQAQLKSEQTAFETELGDSEAKGQRLVPDAVTATAQAKGELAALDRSIASDTAERENLRSRLGVYQRHAEAQATQISDHKQELTRRTSDASQLRKAMTSAESERRSAQKRLQAASTAAAAAEADRRHWKARHEALSLAINENAVPKEVLAHTSGVVGSLADLVSVERHAKAAFAAAVGDPTSIIVVGNTDAATQVLDLLESRDARAAVISLQGLRNVKVSDIGSPHTALRSLVTAAATTGGSAGVSGGGGSGDSADGFGGGTAGSSAKSIERLLDWLLGSTVMVSGDWRDAVAVAAENPDLVVVTASGDRLSTRGWRLGKHSAAGVTAAWREAEEMAAASAATVVQAAQEQHKFRRELDQQTEVVANLRDRLSAAEDAVSETTEALSRINTEQRREAVVMETLQDRLAKLETLLEQDKVRHDALEALLPELERAEEAERDRARARASVKLDLDRRAVGLSTRRAEASATETGIAQRRRMVETRIADVDARLARHHSAREAVARRQPTLERRVQILRALGLEIAARTAAITDGMARQRDLSRRRSEQAHSLAQRLDVLRRQSTQAESRLEKLRHAAAAADIAQAELRTKLQVAVERLRSDHQIAPAIAVDTKCPDLPADTDPRQRAGQLTSELQIMGPVNPLALTEFEELNDRHELLIEQLDDIRAARRALNRVIRSVNKEIERVFADAFADVAANFNELFTALFPGGEGRLTLSDPDDLLSTGIEVEARPSGKRVKRLSLLSGGERTLAALAFLFAVFRSRPSPFYVLDEVEAALDDINLQRFLVLVDEFRADAQLVIVTHQKRTMEAADYLYGVSMKPGGSSIVVSERLSDAA